MNKLVLNFVSKQFLSKTCVLTLRVFGVSSRYFEKKPQQTIPIKIDGSLEFDAFAGNVCLKIVCQSINAKVWMHEYELLCRSLNFGIHTSAVYYSAYIWTLPHCPFLLWHSNFGSRRALLASAAVGCQSKSFSGCCCANDCIELYAPQNNNVTILL